MRALSIVAALVVVAACGPAAPDWNVTGPDGARYRLITCRHHADCLNRAGEVCKAGYVDRYDGKNPKEMMIRCVSEWAE